MKTSTVDYFEYLNSKKEVFTSDLQPLDSGTPTWFDALINHKNFLKIMETFFVDNRAIHHCTDSIKHIKIHDVTKLTHPTLGNVLKMHITWDNCVYNRHTERYRKYMSCSTDLYFTENTRLIPREKDGKTMLVPEAHLLPSGQIINSQFDNILAYTNADRVINGKNYKTFNAEYYEKLAKFTHFDRISELEKKFNEDKSKIESQLPITTSVANESLTARRRKFIIQVKYNSLIDKNTSFKY